MSEQTNNPIRSSIDNIEPADGARERMLRNIRRKAAEQTSQTPQETAKPKTLPLNRILKWALPAAACLVIAVVGIRVIPGIVSSPVDSGSEVQIANPFQAVNSADEFEERLKFRIDAPAGSEDIAYSILDGEIAQADFIFGGNSYTLRASKQSGDFSGINGTLIKSDKIDAANDAVLETIRGMEFNYYKLTWTDGAVNYILANNTEIATEDITGVYEKLK